MKQTLTQIRFVHLNKSLIRFVKKTFIMKIFTDKYWMILSKLEFHFNVSRVEKKQLSKWLKKSAEMP